MFLQALGVRISFSNFADFVTFITSTGLDILLMVFLFNWFLSIFKLGGRK